MSERKVARRTVVEVETTSGRGFRRSKVKDKASTPTPAEPTAVDGEQLPESAGPAKPRRRRVKGKSS